MKRLFLAVDLPERITDTITDTYRAIHGARWMDEEHLHITLQFLGNVSEDRETILINALRGVSIAPFALSLKGAGCFPPRKVPRVLWIGIDNTEELIRLHKQTGSSLKTCGFTLEDRRFSPHVTVARLNNAHPEFIGRYLAEHSLFTSDAFEVNSFHLYSSMPGKNGAHYRKEATFVLSS